MTPTHRRRRIGLVSAALLMPLALAGCSEAQQAIDAAQSAVSTGQAMLDACTSASTAWDPGASVEEATAGLTEASEQLSAALDAGASIPGASALLEAIDTSLLQVEGLTQGAEAAASAAAVQALCSALPE